jgi:glycerol-3-phosphate dehydrogenase
MSETFDVIIIGGGINGTGVARDCALRGLKTLLIEKKDLCGGTSGSSSGMIHGGLRYLLYDVKTTKISSKDSGYIQKIAPFLLFRIPFLFLIHGKEGPNAELLETFFEIYDRYSKLKNAKLHTRLNQEEVHRLEPGLASEITGAITFDEWGVDPYRLCLLNAKDAVRSGGEVLLHTEVVDLLFSQDGQTATQTATKKKRVSGVRVRTQDRGHKDYFGKVVLNISGPWISKVCKMAGVDLRLRPGKGIHIVFDRRISNIALMTQTIDRRSVFLLPYENTSIIGTTDDDFYGDPDHLEVTHDEVEYLFQAIERVFPDIRKHRVIATYAGIRPTLYEWGKLEDELSREHKIFDHSREGVEGFLTMAGGKLASYRLMSEELTDVVCKKLNLRKKCETHQRPLPGGEDLISADELKSMAARAGISLYALSRL